MLISYQWIRSLIGEDPGASVLADKLTSGGLEVESITHVGANLASVRIATVISSRPHPTSKNPLTLVTIATGGDATIEVVCGAPNVPPPGGAVCFAPIGTQVFDKKGQLFTLEAKPVAGVVSQGMLCAEDELGLGTDHDGILIVPNGTAGQALTDYFPAAEDWIMDVNVTPNRGDALGHIGVARDAAALLGIQFRIESPAKPARSRARRGDEEVTIRIEDRERCPRYDAALVDEVSIRPSPLWLRTRLHRLGVRPISNVVDVTNVVMLEYGQPMHAFDLDLVAKRTIVVRRARAAETLQTLDGVTRTLGEDDLVIADADRALALAGVMGGEGSGISAGTRKVLLESAYFDPRGVRRVSKRHAIHSESSHRFERDVDVSGVPRALAKAQALLGELAGGVSVGDPIDVYPVPHERRSVSMRYARVTAVLGHEIPQGEIESNLERLGFEQVSGSRAGTTVLVPLHRPDVTREIDLIEEAARIHGYDKIPYELPPTSGARAGSRRDFDVRRKLRDRLTSLGLDEAVSYAFIAPKEIAAAGLGDVPVVRIANPLSEERSVMRPSLLPRLLAATAHTQRHGVPRVRLFEVGTVFAPGGDDDSPVHERTRVGMILAGPRDTYLSRPSDVDFFDAKGLVEALIESLVGTAARYHTDVAAPSWAHPRAFAHVEIAGNHAGTIAELHPDVRDALGLSRATVVVELEAAPFGKARAEPVARAPGRFPTVRRDVALLVAKSEPAGRIASTLRDKAGALCERVELFDRYEGKELPEGTHSLAFALWFRSNDRTLTDEEVDGWTKSAVASSGETHGAKQR